MTHFGLQFNNQFAQLPAHFYTKLLAEKVSQSPSLIHFNPAGCQLIGLDEQCFTNPAFIQAMSGNTQLIGSEPLAMAYSGHQFGVWAGQLGDGRALLLGQIQQGNTLWDLQLKGAGLTPYSRMGDGRAVMRSSIREYLCAEAMHALGIPTTRSLCLLNTHQPVWRETQEPGAILSRIAQTHIRFGHFEHLYYNRLWDEISRLADHVIKLYFSPLNQQPPTYEQWFLEIVERTARMIAGWMAVGFCHGVMNTDNMSITGLTIDYGPYGFLENFNPSHICNHSDEGGRYAYNRQPAVALWNLQALAHALQPILPLEQSEPLLKQYAQAFEHHYDRLMSQKIGFENTCTEANTLWNDLLILLRESQADYHLAFSALAKALTNTSEWTKLFCSTPEKNTQHNRSALKWLKQFKQAHNIDKPPNATIITQLQKTLSHANPTYVLRNWVAEAAIRAVEDDHDNKPLDEILYCLQNPFTPQETPLSYDYAKSAPAQFQNLSLSCSS